MIDIRQPNITANTPEQKLVQMQSYLYQLAQQLQWAFSTVSASDSGGAAQTESSSTGGGANVNPQKTFAALKGLIIKSADIVNAYYDEISSRLEGTYVAQSDFGEYSQATAQEIRQNSTGITQLFSNDQEITQTVAALETNAGYTEGRVHSLESANADLASAVAELQAIGTNAYIKTGLLYEDGNGMPVYGLEIGQTNNVNGVNVFSKFARFCAEKLSFYDSNDTEIAYISDYKLYITNAEITGSLRIINRFKIYYNNGLAFQWIGGQS